MYIQLLQTRSYDMIKWIIWKINHGIAWRMFEKEASSLNNREKDTIYMLT